MEHEKKELNEQTEEMAAETPAEETAGTQEAAAEQAEEKTEPMEEPAAEATEEEPEHAETPAVEKQPVPKAPKARGNKLKRGGVTTLMAVIFIAIVVVVNILVGALTERFPSMNVDLTAEKLNTLSDQALEIDHAEDELTSGCVLLETEARHRVLDISDLFAMRSNQTTYQQEIVSQVDSALAGALEQVNMQNVPLIAVATGHNEMLNSTALSAFNDLMERQNFEVREIDFLTEEIPAETQVLMIPTPQNDYTTEEIEKLRAYLDDDSSEAHKTILVTFHTTQEKLPKLEGFLEEWGFSLGEGMVAETDESRMMAAYPSFMLVNARQDKVLTDGSYQNLAVRESRPMSLLFSNNNNIAAYPLWSTADSAYVYVDESSAENPETGEQTVAAMADTYKSINGDNWRRSVVVFGSSFVFTDSFISAPAYGDSNYIRDLLQYATGTDGSQVTVQTKQVQTRVLDVSAPQSTVVLLGLGVFTIGIPLVIVVIGLVVFLKRRHL